MRVGRSAGFALLVLVCTPLSGLDYLPGREVAKPHSEVMDSFFGYFIGVVDADATGMMDTDYLHEVLPEFVGLFSMPMEELGTMTRLKEGESIAVTLTFKKDVHLDIPLKILWDTPGYLEAGGSLTLEEKRYEKLVIPVSKRRNIELAPVYAYEVTDGYFFIDFDDWLDILLGNAVDDLYITAVVVFKFDDTWYGAMMGRGYREQAVIGIFNFKNNRILVPIPYRFQTIGPFFLGLQEGT